jgi:hypothetical protein
MASLLVWSNIKPVASLSVSAHDPHDYPGDHEGEQKQDGEDDYV